MHQAWCICSAPQEQQYHQSGMLLAMDPELCTETFKVGSRGRSHSNVSNFDACTAVGPAADHLSEIPDRGPWRRQPEDTRGGRLQ